MMKIKCFIFKKPQVPPALISFAQTQISYVPVGGQIGQSADGSVRLWRPKGYVGPVVAGDAAVSESNFLLFFFGKT